MTSSAQQLQHNGIGGEREGIVPIWNHGASTAIGTAITAANHRQNGVTYEPFQMKVVPGTDFINIWNSDRGTTPITFFQFWGSGPFLPLGDVVMLGSANNQTWPTYQDGAMLFAPSAAQPDALAHPVGFQWILDDYRSGNSRDIKYFRLLPPAGYSALGIAFTNGGAPDVNRYWCVSNRYLQSIGRQFFWSDDGQHWTKHTGDLWKPAFEGTAPSAPDGQMLLVPPTYLSFEDRGNETAWALVMGTANLDVTVPTPDPVYDAQIQDGRTTTFGVKSVKVMPFTTVADPGYTTPGLNSPFYYIAAEPFWYCSEVLDTREGGDRTRTVTVGVSQTKAEMFRQSTSITVSAEVGAAYEAVSAKVSTSFTREWELTTAQSTTHSTQVQTSETVSYPKNPRLAVWEHHTQISVYRTDNTQLPPVSYANRTTRFLP